MSLSSLIVQREVASIRQVEEALARQVLYGDDLVTNLLEVVQLPESVLLRLLAESVGLPPAPVGMLPAPTPQARALVPEDVAIRRMLMPLMVDGEVLVVAVSEPLGRDVLDELSFAFGVRLDERVAPSVRIREALARVYGLPLERRMARLLGRLAGVDPGIPHSLPPVAVPKASAPPLPGALSHDVPRLNPPGMPDMGSLGFPDSAPLPPEPPAAPRPPSAAPPRPSLPNLVRHPRPTTELPRRRGPITLDRVNEELAEIHDREGLLQLFFDFSRQFFEYSAIFVVHGDLAEGRDGFGSGAPRERVLALGVPLDLPSILRTVRDRGAPACLFPDPTGIDAVLMGDLRRDPRSQVLVAPLVVRNRVVAFFVADDGAAGIAPSALGEVTTVAALVGREFERLIVRMKLQGFTGAAPAPERRVDPRRVEPKRRRVDPEARDAAVQALVAAMPTLASPEPAAVAAPAASVDVLVPDHAAVHPAGQPGPPPAEPRNRPGALRPDAFAAPAPHQTLRNFPVPKPEEALPELDATDKVPEVAPEVVPEAAHEPVAEASLEVVPEALPEVVPGDPVVEPFAPVEHEAEAVVPASRRGLKPELADLPPPPQALVVRPLAPHPIPREEVDEDGSPISSTRFAHERISSRPPPADLRQARLMRSIDAIASQFVRSEPPARVSIPARGGQAVTLPPHRPPTSRTHEPLPSVIVDVKVQTDRLAEAFVADPKNEQIEAELLRLGQQAMPSIMKHFPGPITILRDTLDDSWPRVTDCGPILRLIARQRRVALPFVLGRTEDADTESRFWATYLLTELVYADAIPALVARLFDDSKRVRRAARLVAHLLGEAAPEALIAELDRIVRDPKATPARRVVTLDALGEMRDPLVVPVLLGAMGYDDEDIELAARRALILVCRQDFGRDMRKWLAWWNAWSGRHRIEWLIEALNHDVPALRRAAGQELKALTEEYFGYYDDLPKKDRERAQQRYREWWKTDGQARFRKG